MNATATTLPRKCAEVATAAPSCEVSSNFGSPRPMEGSRSSRLRGMRLDSAGLSSAASQSPSAASLLKPLTRA